MPAEFSCNSWMHVPDKIYGFSGNRYEASTLDLELVNFSSGIGRICEHSALTLLQDPDLSSCFSNETSVDSKKVRSFIMGNLQKLPNHRLKGATFKNKDLYPLYIDALWDPEIGHSISCLAEATDKTFLTEFTKGLDSLAREAANKPEDNNLYRLINPKARYLVDGLLAISKFSSDQTTQRVLKSFGQILPDVRIGSTQLDGVFLDRNIEIPELTTQNQLLEFLSNISESRFRGMDLTPTFILNECSILEIKTDLRANHIAQKPPRLTPTKPHLAQILNSVRKACAQPGQAIAPNYLVLFYLGSLQPNSVDIIKADYYFWLSMLKDAEQRLANPPEQPKDEDYFKGLGEFYILAQEMVTELQDTEKVIPFSSNGEFPEMKQFTLNITDGFDGTLAKWPDFEVKTTTEKVKVSKPKNNSTQMFSGFDVLQPGTIPKMLYGKNE